ncbi:hypothetical protein EQM14_01710 [Caproiciproducens sp. NJN-50]|uniref:hypothetical protein n=1 Tax=Caproiciproducens sp. NJN-50 TaxID=2507162 RepID=UPI000FFE3052|nr:hypothetical protein [Caproiciproducens sp. NJN-50]QAT48600.1 hypothetical protein EQM14_01710 [Caproiciproducens sp. NJN-50]
MAYQSWRVWDGTSALAGVPQATPEALTKAYSLDSTKQLIIYKDADGNEGNVRVYASTVSTETIQADFDAEVARQEAEAGNKTDLQKLQEQVAYTQAAQLAIQAYIAQQGGTT